MTERGFHPFAVLHFLRKTLLVYLLPLLQVLFQRNWQALWAALAQDAALFFLLTLVSAAVLHASRWQVDEEGCLCIRWRLVVRLDRCLRADGLAALTIERPLLYRLAEWCFIPPGRSVLSPCILPGRTLNGWPTG